jgi:hypothetical protein
MKVVLSRRSIVFGVGSTLMGWLGWLVGGKSSPGQNPADSPGALAGRPAPPARLGRPPVGRGAPRDLCRLRPGGPPAGAGHDGDDLRL